MLVILVLLLIVAPPNLRSIQVQTTNYTVTLSNSYSTLMRVIIDEKLKLCCQIKSMPKFTLLGFFVLPEEYDASNL